MIDVINKVLDFNFSNENNKRSSKRTDILHKGIIDSYINKDNYDKIIYEDKINCFYGKSFNIDVGLYKNGILDVIILFKFSQTSINKNTYNNLNNKAGELIRLAEYIDLTKIIFIEIMPSITYTIKEKSKFTKENVYDNHIKLKTLKENPIISKINSDNLYFYNIWFEPNELFFKQIEKNVLGIYDNTQNNYINNIIIPENFLKFN